MTWQTIAYFSSIVVTCLLTGFLTWYAWRQRSIPGALYFAGLTLGECLLALAEIFSMISRTQTQAAFWFNVRFLFNATIPVFLLGFAVEHYGHKGWLSKRLMAAIFVIPLLTQIILWSNNLHRIWVVQDVSFHRNGPFWIAVTSDRIPGFWFMVHSLYGLVLFVTAITVILITAWNQRRVYRMQAIFLLIGALIVLVTSMIPVLNLMPQLEFNFFIPGIGASAVFIAMAVFRFEFLEKPFSPKRVPGLRSEVPQNKRSQASYLLVFGLLVVGITAGGYSAYAKFKNQYLAQVANQLSTIGSLKIDELENWRSERLADAEVLHRNPALASLIQNFIEDPGDLEATRQLQTWLDSLSEAYNYEQVFLLDTSGVIKISSPSTLQPIAAHLVKSVTSTLQGGKVDFQDFHFHENDNSIHLSLLVPIYIDQKTSRPLGVLVLEIDPVTYLYPYLSKWPASSETAETLLVRREGENVLFLNPLRFQPDAALNLRISIKDTEVLAVQAVLGGTGVVEGVDYRYNRVIGFIGAVPDSPWFLVARMDIGEESAPLKQRLWQTIIFFGALIAASGTILAMIWRQQRIQYFQAQVETLDALKASEEKFRLAFSTSPDSIAINRMADGEYVSVNHGFTQILGYKEEEVIGKTSQAIGVWENLQDRQRLLATLQVDGAVENFEAPFHTKDGSIRHGMMSAAIINLNGQPHILNITRDITERKKADEILKSYSAQLEKEVEKRSHELKEAQEKILRQDRLASLGQLAGSISHELRNPLGVMNNAMYFLTESQPEASDEVKKYYQILEDEIHTADKIIKDLLDFSRIKSIDRRPVKPGSLVEQTLERFPAPEAVRLRLVIPQELPVVLVDPRQMVQVLGNLVANAYQAMPGGGALTITAESQDGMVSISIKDTGTGIPPENMDKLFEPLFTTKARGIGLGLSVSQKLAEANGGRIEVASEPGRGSTFTVFLPVEKEVV